MSSNVEADDRTQTSRSTAEDRNFIFGRAKKRNPLNLRVPSCDSIVSTDVTSHSSHKYHSPMAPHVLQYPLHSSSLFANKIARARKSRCFRLTVSMYTIHEFTKLRSHIPNKMIIHPCIFPVCERGGFVKQRESLKHGETSSGSFYRMGRLINCVLTYTCTCVPTMTVSSRG